MHSKRRDIGQFMLTTQRMLYLQTYISETFQLSRIKHADFDWGSKFQGQAFYFEGGGMRNMTSHPSSMRKCWRKLWPDVD